MESELEVQRGWAIAGVRTRILSQAGARTFHLTLLPQSHLGLRVTCIVSWLCLWLIQTFSVHQRLHEFCMNQLPQSWAFYFCLINSIYLMILGTERAYRPPSNKLNFPPVLSLWQEEVVTAKANKGVEEGGGVREFCNVWSCECKCLPHFCLPTP